MSLKLHSISFALTITNLVWCNSKKCRAMLDSLLRAHSNVSFFLSKKFKAWRIPEAYSHLEVGTFQLPNDLSWLWISKTDLQNGTSWNLQDRVNQGTQIHLSEDCILKVMRSIILFHSMIIMLMLWCRVFTNFPVHVFVISTLYRPDCSHWWASSGLRAVCLTLLVELFKSGFYYCLSYSDSLNSIKDLGRTQ